MPTARSPDKDRETLTKEERLGRFGFSVSEQTGAKSPRKREAPTSSPERGKPAKEEDAAKSTNQAKKRAPLEKEKTTPPSPRKKKYPAPKGKYPIRNGITSPRKKEPSKSDPISEEAKPVQTEPTRNNTKTMNSPNGSPERSRDANPTGKTGERVPRVQNPLSPQRKKETPLSPGREPTKPPRPTGRSEERVPRVQNPTSPERKKDETPLSPGREQTKARPRVVDKVDEDARKRLRRRLNYVVVPPPRREQTREKFRRKKTAVATEDVDIPLASSEPKSKLPNQPYTVKDATDLYIREYTLAKARSILTKPSKSTKKPRSKAASNVNTPYMSPRLNVPPRPRKEVVLNVRESEMYRAIHSVYDDEKAKKNRLNQFMRKLQRLQLEQWRLQAEEERAKDSKKEQAKWEQSKQLKFVRERFDDEQVRVCVRTYVCQFVAG